MSNMNIYLKLKKLCEAGATAISHASQVETPRQREVTDGAAGNGRM